MASSDNLKQAARDVLRFHTRRVHVPQAMSKGEQRIFYGSLAITFVGLIIAKVNHALMIPGVILGCAFPIGHVVLLVKSTIKGARNPTRKEAAEANLRYNKAIHLLTHSTDPEAIGPLTDVLWLPEITGYVPLALRLLLPTLQPEHAALLNAKQRASLLRILAEPDPTAAELQKVTARTMGRAGDKSALPILEQLAAGEGIAAESPVLREEARTALYTLQERIDPGYLGRNLLRAAEAPNALPAQLLRPATGSVETPSQELLRSHSAPSSDCGQGH